MKLNIKKFMKLTWAKIDTSNCNDVLEFYAEHKKYCFKISEREFIICRKFYYGVNDYLMNINEFDNFTELYKKIKHATYDSELKPFFKKFTI